MSRAELQLGFNDEMGFVRCPGEGMHMHGCWDGTRRSQGVAAYVLVCACTHWGCERFVPLQAVKKATHTKAWVGKGLADACGRAIVLRFLVPCTGCACISFLSQLRNRTQSSEGWHRAHCEPTWYGDKGLAA